MQGNLKKTQKYNNKNEVKFTNNRKENIPESIQDFITFLNSSIFIKFLQNLTSINETLMPDPHLEGGGLHELKNGGKLKIHTDFHLHPSLGLDRRINALIYLNKDWKDSYGGIITICNIYARVVVRLSYTWSHSVFCLMWC